MLKLEIVTPEKRVVETEADSVTVRQPIELRRAQQFRAAQSLPATHFLGLAAIARVPDGDRNQAGRCR